MPERITLESNDFAMEIQGEKELETWRRAKQTMDAYLKVQLQTEMEDEIGEALQFSARKAQRLDRYVREKSPEGWPDD